LIALVAPAVAQKAQIEAVNAKWMDLFSNGVFEGIAQLYTVDAIPFPPATQFASHIASGKNHQQRYRYPQ
jgi:ketosteroid isomerase-like protein